jgi:dihydropyrimidine dehydrogenase (NADP+)
MAVIRRRSTLKVLRASSNGTSSHPDAAVELVNGKVTSGPDLSVEVNGLKLPNPFVIGSGPPGTNYKVMKKAFDEGWGGVICKTLSLDSSKVHTTVEHVYAGVTDSRCANHGTRSFRDV